MTTNVDPTGPVPEPDASGQLVLDETKANYILEAFMAFMALGAVLFCMMYWVFYYTRSVHPVIANKNIYMLVAAGFVALPFVPVLLADLALPPRLVVSESGIALRRRGLTRSLSWSDLSEIRLHLQVTYTKTGSYSKTISYAIGRAGRLVWPPVFGVSPTQLADYLQARGQRETGGIIAVTQGSGASAFMRMEYALWGGALVLCLIGLLVIWLTLGVVGNNPAAIWIALHLPNLNAHN